LSDVNKFYDGQGLEGVEHFEALWALRHVIAFNEDERQTVLLALAELSIARPGWVNMLNEIALKMDNKDQHGHAEMFEGFRQLHAGPVTDALKNS
jgi:hypothetical protein